MAVLRDIHNAFVKWESARVVAYYWMGVFVLPLLLFGKQWPQEWLRYLCFFGMFILLRWVFKRCREIWSGGLWRASDTLVFVFVPAFIFLFATVGVLRGTTT